ncbi:MAG TPA: hypothetical protein VGM91_00380 [Conexibacter sp.]
MGGRDRASVVNRASATVTRLSCCPRGRRGARCRAPRALTAKHGDSGSFSVRSPRLAGARYRFAVTVIDAAGNRSRAAVAVVATAARR